MGGRLCLRLALDRPDLVRGLMLVSASPGIADAAERAARVEADELLADSVERDGVDAFLDDWLAQPMFATVPPDAPGLADRRRLTPEFLAACLRRLGAGAMEPMWSDVRAAHDAGDARDRHPRREVHRDRAAHARTHAPGRRRTCSSTAGTRCRSSSPRCSAA